MKIKVKREVLEKMDLPWSNVIEEKLVDQRRWYNVFEIVFEMDGKFWKTKCHHPGTEIQEDIDTWDEQEEIELTQVEKKEVKIWKWVDKKD